MNDADLLARDLLRACSALLLSPPTPEAFATLSDADTRAVISVLLGDAACDTLAPLASLAWSDTLREEFFALFAVPGERYLAPFESVWCDRDESRPEGLLAGPSASTVARFYARHGVALDQREMPDHLGCELGFLASLDDREAARSFAREHPARFVDALRDAATRDGEARLYPAVLALAATLVKRFVI